MTYPYAYDHRREILWKEVARYIRKDVGAVESVLDLGAGYCHFINNMPASRKYALDDSAEPLKNAGRGVTPIVRPCWDLSCFEPSSIDFIFASNLLEHLTIEQALFTLSEVNRVLRKGGSLAVIGPNYYYCYRMYWDDFTHRLALSHRSLASMLQHANLRVVRLKKKFLPLTISGMRIPIRAWMVRGYLMSPFKPFGRQMYIRAVKE